MPRRPPAIFQKIPLFVVGPLVKDELKKVGEELVRVVIRQAKGHCYDIFIHTRSVYRVLRSPVQRAVPIPVPVPADYEPAEAKEP